MQILIAHSIPMDAIILQFLTIKFVTVICRFAPKTGDFAYPLWAAVIGGLIAIIFAALHAATPQPNGGIFGAIVSHIHNLF